MSIAKRRREAALNDRFEVGVTNFVKGCVSPAEPWLIVAGGESFVILSAFSWP
jgi:hypothetical protein